MSKNNNEEELRKAAIFLMSLNHEEASKIIKFLEVKEVQKLGLAMTELNNVDKNLVKKIQHQFMFESDKKTSIGINNDEKVKKLLVGGLGEDKANTIIDKLSSKNDSRGIENLKWMDSISICDFIRGEHPQIQAVILSYLDPPQAAEILMTFDDELRLDLVERIAIQESIQPSAIDELNKIMENKIKNNRRGKLKSVGGTKQAASIMNFLAKDAESVLIEAIRTKNEKLATALEEFMFIFDDIKKIDDAGIQILIRQVKSDVLVLALKGADEKLKEKIFKNMSKRSAQLLKDDFEAKGPVRIREVEEAQKQIITMAKALAEEGKIMLGTNAEEMI